MQPFSGFGREREVSDAGVSAIVGTLLLVVLTVAVASIFCYVVLAMNMPQNVTKTGMKIVNYNLSTIAVTSLVGDSIQEGAISVVVGPSTYNGSGLVDSNHNGYWDPGETLFVYGLDLLQQSDIIICAGSQVLMTGSVPILDSSGVAHFVQNDFTVYKPGLRMTTYKHVGYADPISSVIVDNISFASPTGQGMGFSSNDPNWPYSIAGKSSEFSVRFVGSLFADSNSTFHIRLITSDSSYLMIDNHMIIAMNGTHMPYNITSDQEVSQGYHTLEVGYVNYYNVPVIELEITTVSNMDLCHKEDVNE